MEASRAESTVKKYKNAIAAWEVWCRLNRMSVLCPSHLDLARYFIDMYNNDAPFSRIETAFYGIKWKLDTSSNGCDKNPCDLRFLHLLLEGLKRILAKPIHRKEPITPEILRKVVQKFDDGGLKGIRICSMLLLAYAGFLRFNELSSLKLCDIDICSSHVQLFIESSKTDQFREGAWVIIGATGNNTCPVAMLKKYLNCASVGDLTSSEYLYRPIVLFKSKNKYELRTVKLSYSRCREIFKEALEEIGVDSSNFGLHSPRAGGASAAAAIGVPDRLFKRHGRWKSDSSKDRYVKESLTNKLLVSMNLGI